MNKKVVRQVSASWIKAQEELARKPPLGWNSYDCFGMLATEGDIKANADYMAMHLKKYGWEYVVLDYLWYAGLCGVDISKKGGQEYYDSIVKLYAEWGVEVWVTWAELGLTGTHDVRDL